MSRLAEDGPGQDRVAGQYMKVREDGDGWFFPHLSKGILTTITPEPTRIPMAKKSKAQSPDAEPTTPASESKVNKSDAIRAEADRLDAKGEDVHLTGLGFLYQAI